MRSWTQSSTPSLAVYGRREFSCSFLGVPHPAELASAVRLEAGVVCSGWEPRGTRPKDPRNQGAPGIDVPAASFLPLKALSCESERAAPACGRALEVEDSRSRRDH